MSDLETIAEAFSRTAAKYDALTDDNPHLTRLRNKVYAHVSRHVAAGARILELNAGTGIDAVALAQRGYALGRNLSYDARGAMGDATKWN